MDASRSRPWVAAALAVLVALFVVDLATGPDVVVIALYGIAPLLASLGASWRATAGVGALARWPRWSRACCTTTWSPPTGSCSSSPWRRWARWRPAARSSAPAASGRRRARACSPRRARRWPAAASSTRGCAPSRPRLAARSRSGRSPRPGAPLLARGERLGTLALRRARPRARRRARPALRRRDRQRRAWWREADEAYGMLDAMFARAPSGSRSTTASCGYVRINDHLAEINGVPAAEQHRAHGRRDRPRRRRASARTCASVLETGREPLDRASRSPARRRAAPGVRARVRVASYWPVRAARRRRACSASARVVFEVTERRARRARAARADRPLRVAAARALGGRRGHGRARGRRPLVYANPAFEQLAATRSAELPALQSMFDLVERGRARGRRAGARGCGSRASVDPGYPLDAAPPRRPPRDARDRGRAARASAGRRQMVVVGRDVTARARAPRPSASGCSQRAAFLAEASAAFDAVLDEERDARQRSRACACATSPTRA